MASTHSLGFRSTKYVHPVQEESHTTKGKAESKGWTPIRSVIAVAEERQRQQPLTAQLRGIAGYHILESKRPSRSYMDFESACLIAANSSRKRSLRLRQTLPAFRG